MCLDIKLFAKYKPANENVEFVANNNSCKVVGVGTGKIEMFVRTLPNVLHVPDL